LRENLKRVDGKTSIRLRVAGTAVGRSEGTVWEVRVTCGGGGGPEKPREAVVEALLGSFPPRNMATAGSVIRQLERSQRMDLAVRKTALERLGLDRIRAVHENLPPARLVEAAVRRREGMLTENGALVAKTGKRTGRSPKDKFVVEDDLTRHEVAWGPTNRAFSPEAFDALLRKATEYLGSLEDLYVVDAKAGADERYALGVRVVCEHA